MAVRSHKIPSLGPQECARLLMDISDPETIKSLHSVLLFWANEAIDRPLMDHNKYETTRVLYEKLRQISGKMRPFHRS
jgi:hypothetical protein